MVVRVDIRNEKAVRDSLNQAARLIHGDELVNAMQRATLIVSADAKRFAPVDTGRLRSSITEDIRMRGLTNALQGVVGSSVEYAPYMEFGTGIPAGEAPVKFPPPQALEGWARRHNASAFAIALAIYRRGGLEPRAFFQRALEKNEQRIRDILNQGVRNAIQRAGLQ